MSRNSSFVEINGKRYDIITGQLIGAVKHAHHRLQNAGRGPVIDGFVRQVAKHSSRSSRSAQAVHSRRQHSKTLMRTIVSAPAKSKNDKQQTPARISKSFAASKQRLQQAKLVPKHRLVKRFDDRPLSSTHAKTPNHRAVLSGEVINRESTAESAATAARPLPSMVSSASHHHLERLLDEALVRADSHKKAAKNGRRSKRFFNRWFIAAIALLLIIAAGLTVWRYIPQTSLKVASMRAKVNGTLPTYVPSGFKTASPINYADGAVQITYKADDGRSFKVMQQRSNLDSKALESNIVSPSSQIQTAQIKGTTVYIYDSRNNATWVSEGILYTIEGDARLSSDQMLKIADSL